MLNTVSYIVLRNRADGRFGLSLSTAATSLVAFIIGFAFRLTAIWFFWEEPLDKGD